MSKEHTSLELSKRLHDKGFRGEHLSIYYKDGRVYKGFPEELGIPAYTFTEIWGVLPSEIDSMGDLTVYKHRITREAICIYIDGIKQSKLCMHESPAEAAGLLLEWLIDNGHVEVGA